MDDVSSRIERLSPEQRALLERRLRATSPPASPRPVAEPVAIVGMGCRFPGGANNPDAFWRLLKDGVDAISEVPRDRWDVDSLYDADPTAAGKMSTRWGGFLARIDEFDAAFFGISPREAVHMDPQQRLLLEVAWEALEDAGQPVERLAGRAAGVFVGIHSLSNDYFLRQVASLGSVDAYTSTGVAHSIVANRLSYLLDLRGPSLAVDTACSSSLVAVHLACQSLRLGECDLALAGGVNLILLPEATVAFSKLNMMAADGRCKAFDARADGFVRGEGCGVVVLRRLADALAESDPILAVIRGTAVNQDGATNGITAPSSPAQQAVIRRALDNGGREGKNVSYVETHGTGTALGDPIEVEALAETLGSNGAPCLLGAVKTNIGHLEAAAGIAGLIKAVLCLSRRFIPPNLHFRAPNPHMDLPQTRFVVPTEGRAWAMSNGTPRIAGVSSFGFGGTNAHVVLEEAPAAFAPGTSPEGGPLPLPLSARSPDALRALAADYAAFLADAQRGGVLRRLDVAHTAGMRRTHHAYRAAVVGASREEWIAALQGLAERPSRLSPAEHPPGLVFVYSGQGPQWPGMGLGLYRTEPVFRARLDDADAEVRKLAGWSLIDALGASDDRLRQTDVAQPAVCALQVALTDLLREWGIEPECVLGHSAGEVAAAYSVGALGFSDAIRVAVERGRLMQEAAGRGEMLAIELPVEEAESAIVSFDGALEVASVNSPTSTVIAGKQDAIAILMAGLVEQGVFCKRVNTEFAFHTRQMEPFQEPLVQALRGLRAEPPQFPIFSSLRGGRAAEGDYGPLYWARGIRERVRFADALEACAREGHEVFVELGPHPVLIPMIRRCGALVGRELMAIASLRRNEDEAKSMLETLGSLYRLGYPVDWARCLPSGGRVVSLPLYPWQRKRFWIDEPTVSSPVGHVNSATQPVEERLDKLTYAIDWRRLERAERAYPALEGPGSWLILADRGGVGTALADRLRERGETCVLVRASNDAFAADLDRVLRDEWKSNGLPRRGVVHLWSLDAPATEAATPLSLEAAHALGCASALQVARALFGAAGPRQWLVTRGAQPAGALPQAVEAAQAPLWGLGRVLALEQPESWGGLIDLDPAQPAREAARRLMAEITQPDGEDQVAFRDRDRYVARLVHEPLGSTAPLRLSDGSYLVTGGLGALGLQVARWIVDRGARHIVLTSRTGLPGQSGVDTLAEGDSVRRVEAVRALEALGASVIVAVADAGDAVAMAAVFASFGRTLPPLRGVVHAAGVTTEATLASMDPAALLAVLRPKATGAWVLHELTRELELDFFVLFSSAAAVWGSKGLGHYAAANHFLDALAHRRHAQGLPALSVNWGWWSGAGIASAPVQEAFRRAGVEELRPEQALEALGRLLACGSVQKTVAAVDWSVFKPVYEARRSRPLVLEVGAPASTRRREPAPEHRSLRDRLASASPAERRHLLGDHVAREVGQLLRFGPEERIEPRQGFFKLGMDSIMTVQLRNRLEASLGRLLPHTVAFEYPTIESLAAYLAGEAPPAAAATGGGPAKRRMTLPSTLPEELSEDELASLLAQKLDEMAIATGTAKIPRGNAE